MKKISTILVGGLLSLALPLVAAEKEESRVDFSILRSIGADDSFEYLESKVSVVLPDAQQLIFRQLEGTQVAMPKDQRGGGMTRLQILMTWQVSSVVVDELQPIDQNLLLCAAQHSPDKKFVIYATSHDIPDETKAMLPKLLRISGKAESKSARPVTFVIRAPWRGEKVEARLVGLLPKNMTVEKLAKQIASTIRWTNNAKE